MKKRIFSLALSFVMMLSIISLGTFTLTASAATSGATGDCTWTLEGTVLTISGNGEMDDYGEWGESSAPWGRDITEVIIEDGVTCIGGYAFEECSSLAIVTIGKGVTKIRDEAFGNCPNLNTVNFNAINCTYMGSYYLDSNSDAFFQSFNISQVNIGDKVEIIPDYAFSRCPKIKEFIIPDSVEYIGIEAFGSSAYFSDPNNWENKLLYNGKHLLKALPGITSCNIKEGTKTIAGSAFKDCSKLESITIPQGIKSIGTEAFKNCSVLASITLPGGVTSIGDRAFQYCHSLTSITIPDSVTSIGRSAFYCYDLTNVYINDLAAWCNISFGYYDIDSNGYSNPLYYADNLYINGELSLDIIIPQGVTSISDAAFCGYSSLTSITIPDSVTSIGNGAFESCFSLKDVYITDLAAWCNIIFEYESFSYDGPSYCSNPLYYADNLYINKKLALDITIPQDVTNISNAAFYGCSTLQSITIPKCITKIGDHAFYGCSNLKYAMYEGSKGDRNQIQIDAFSNEDISFGAFWHYEATDHSWDSGKITTQPSCAEGVKTYSCTLDGCDGTKTELVPATGNHAPKTVPGYAADCWDDGLSDATVCNSCGEVLLPATVIPSPGHQYEWVVDTVPVCGIMGIKHEECKGCGRTRSQNTAIPTSGSHSFNGGVVTKAPTITSLGTKTFVCKNCNHTYAEPIPKLTPTPSTPSVPEVKPSTPSKPSVPVVKPNTPTTHQPIRGSLKSAKVTVKDQTYSGKAKKPSVTVKLNGKTLKKNVDYTVTYKNNKKIGKATVTITGKGAYKDSVKATFKINPKKVASLKVKAGKKQMTVSFKKDKSVGGYEIVYATSKNFKKGKKTVKVTKAKTVKKVIKKLKSKKTYYVKVRAFKKVGKTTYYGAYTSAKKVKIK